MNSEFLGRRMNYWLVKQEPEDFSWAKFAQEGRTAWTGIRNFQARNFLRAMAKGDLVAFYHTGSEKQVVGLCRVAKTAYPDPTAEEGDWSCVDLAPLKHLALPVTLATMKADVHLKNLLLIKQSRLSVLPLKAAEFNRLLELSKTRL